MSQLETHTDLHTYNIWTRLTEEALLCMAFCLLSTSYEKLKNFLLHLCMQVLYGMDHNDRKFIWHKHLLE